LLVFFAFAMQCMSTLAVVRRETGNWRWPAMQFLYMGALAYLGALAANQGLGALLGK
jgi:ferrous iron transport protein B